MTNYLAQFQAIKNASDRIVVAVEDVSELWPIVKEKFEEKLPFKKASLNNKTRNPVYIENLPAEFILTTDARLRSRVPQELSLFWFREPYATIILVSCEDLDEFKTILKPRLKLIVQNDEREWFIVFVSKALPDNDQATKLAKKVYSRLEVDFSTKKRERCCKFDLHGNDSSFWEDLESKIVESIRNTLDRRVQFYEEEVRKLTEQRFMPVWSFSNFFILKESLAFMFEMVHLYEDALREYDELELCYLETVNTSPIKQREFGGFDHGDDQAMLLKPDHKPLTQFIQDDSFREFEFRQYLFACQSKLLFKLSRPAEVSTRGYSFIINYSKLLASHENDLPFCLREIWVITACLAIIKYTTFHYDGGLVTAEVEKEFYRLQGDFFSLSRVKFMRLAYLIGHGAEIDKSPVNSAELSMLPWPRPAVWPLVPPDVSSEIFEKEKIMLQSNPTAEHFGIQRKALPLEPSSLLREANRRRASLSTPNLSDLSDGRQNLKDGSGVGGSSRFSPQNKERSSSMPRTYSSPMNIESSHVVLDRPMRLSEIQVASEHALKKTLSDPDLWTSLSSKQNFEAAVRNLGSEKVLLEGKPEGELYYLLNKIDKGHLHNWMVAALVRYSYTDLLTLVFANIWGPTWKKYMELTKGAADNYHRSWWKRHAVALDGEIAAVYFRHGDFDLAANSYEKVCALYAGEGWHDLLADVLPYLAECQKILNDEAGYLSSCVRLLSMDDGLFLTKERQTFQSEVVRLAHSEMKNPVPLDVSSLITFSGTHGPPLELCDGDSGTLSVTVWSGFPDDIILESLNLTLTVTFTADEGINAIKCSNVTILKPGRNTIILDLPPQQPGSYVLGVLTGQIGHLRFRSHSFSKGGPPDSDDFMSYEKPVKPVLKVFKPRSLVDISAAVSSALLMNEVQWVGMVVKPINYSLRGSILHIDTGPELDIKNSQMIEIENSSGFVQDSPNLVDTEITRNDANLESCGNHKRLVLENGKIELPDWASNVTTIVWLPVCATDKKLSRGTSAACPQRQSVLDGMRIVALKLEFGASRNQKFERTVAVHFTDPFHISTRITDRGNDGALLLQVILHSQVKATLTIYDVWLDLQEGFEHIHKDSGRPSSSFFPLVISPSSRASILFSICLTNMVPGVVSDALQSDSILNIKYGISGERTTGAHEPVSESSDGSKVELHFKSAIFLQRPVLDPCLAVGFLPFPSDCLRVGQLVRMEWRVERLKETESLSSTGNDEVLYEVDASPENWMIAGRKRGHVSLCSKRGSRIVVTVTCIPLVSGYVHPPHLGLPDVGKANIRCNPPGPHLVCVLPPMLSSSYCVPI